MKVTVGLGALCLSAVGSWAIGLGAIALFPATSLASPFLAAKPVIDAQAQPKLIFPAIAQYSGTFAPAPQSVSTIAKQVTVRILGDRGTGSGVIIGLQGQTYTVLTNAHVVAEVGGDRYSILTPDGRTHTGVWLRSVQFGNYDLALVEFSSDRVYQVAAIGYSDPILIGELVYAAGFPRWRVTNSYTLEDTSNWGLQAFELTQGNIGMLPNKPLQQGYQLGYTNQIEPGMSGGPVFDRFGRLIGINGGLKYPPQGITAFIFADGTMPSPALFQQMETLSWAIPIATFQQLFRQPVSVQGIY